MNNTLVQSTIKCKVETDVDDKLFIWQNCLKRYQIILQVLSGTKLSLRISNAEVRKPWGNQFFWFWDELINLSSQLEYMRNTSQKETTQYANIRVRLTCNLRSFRVSCEPVSFFVHVRWFLNSFVFTIAFEWPSF